MIQSYITIDAAITKLQRGHKLQTRTGNLFDELFSDAWLKLNQYAQHTLSAATFFPDSLDRDRLEFIVNGKLSNDEAIDRAVELLRSLALITRQPQLMIEQPNDNKILLPRYGLHPLVRSFVMKKVEDNQEWQAQATTRWLAWAAQACEEWPWDNIKHLKIIGARDEPAIYAAFNWAVQKKDYASIVKIAPRIDHYYYVCGFWEKKNFLDELWIEAAHNLDDTNEEVKVLAQHIQFLCRLMRLSEVEVYLDRLQKKEQFPGLDENVLTQVRHAHAFYALGKGQYQQAYKIMEECRISPVQPKKKNLAIATLHWLAVCLYRCGRLNGAKQWFERALSQARAANYTRSAIFCQLHLANIALDQERNEEAAVFLEACLSEAIEIEERRYIAQIYLAYARYYWALGQKEQARSSLEGAEDLYNRLKLFDDIEVLNKLQGRVLLGRDHYMQILNPQLDLIAWLQGIESASQRALLLDYDGTLAPFKEKRDEAIPREGVRDILRDILAKGRTRVVIVSGRSLHDIEPLLGIDPLPEIWGSHGWERRLPDGTRQEPQFSQQIRAGFDAALSFIESAKLMDRIERKTSSLAVHWRGLDSAEAEIIDRTVMQGWSPIAQSAGFAIKPFDGGLEMSVPGRDKGMAVRTILAELGRDAVVAYLGDDRTDEDAFRALKGRGTSFQVHDEQHLDIAKRETLADVRLWSPTDLLPFLARWR